MHKYNVSEITGEIRDIFKDSKNNVWFASNGDGVFKFDGIKLTNFTKERKLENPDFIKTFEKLTTAR